jgi:cell division protein FtsB
MASDTPPANKKVQRLVFFGLLGLLLALQYPLWFGNGGVLDIRALKQEIAAQREENARLKERNRTLAAEVVDLKQGLETVEQRARAELGMIKKSETFFQVVDPPASAKLPD